MPEKPRHLARVLADRLSTVVGASMYNIVKGKLIAPVMHYGINEGVGALTSYVAKNLNKSIENFQSQRRIIFLQDGDKDNMIDKKYKQGAATDFGKQKAIEVVEDLQNGGEAGLCLIWELLV